MKILIKDRLLPAVGDKSKLRYNILAVMTRKDSANLTKSVRNHNITKVTYASSKTNQELFKNIMAIDSFNNLPDIGELCSLTVKRVKSFPDGTRAIRINIEVETSTGAALELYDNGSINIIPVMTSDGIEAVTYMYNSIQLGVMYIDSPWLDSLCLERNTVTDEVCQLIK